MRPLALLIAAGLAVAAPLAQACDIGWAGDANLGCSWVGCPTGYAWNGSACVPNAKAQQEQLHGVSGTGQSGLDPAPAPAPAPPPPPPPPQLDGGLYAPAPAAHSVAVGNDAGASPPATGSGGPLAAAGAASPEPAQAGSSAGLPAAAAATVGAPLAGASAVSAALDRRAASPASSVDKAVNELASMPPSTPGVDKRYHELIASGARAMGMGDAKAASRDFDEAVRLDPAQAVGWISLAKAQAKAGLFSAAEKAAREALRVNPRSAAAWDQLAWALLKEGRNADAIEAATHALALDPADAFAYAVRARAKYALGDRAGALADAELASRLDARFAALLDAVRNGRDLPHEDAFADVPRPPPPAGPWDWRLATALLLVAGWLGGRYALGGKDRKARTFSALLPGRRGGLLAGKYELKGLLGSGAMGQVFDAFDHTLNRPVAIKKISGEATRDPQARRRFVAEAQAVAAAAHPNIVSIYEVLAEGEEVHLVFERVDGKTVDRLLAETPRLSLPDTLAIMVPVAAALSFAHGRGLVHRDLKPANIMVARDGFVKLMDFGIARALASDGQARTQTIAGTPYFMAPEMLDGIVSREGDVYALAVTAYRMLTGAYPFQTWEEKRAMAFAAPSARWAALPAALDALMVRALEADPARRLKTPADFVRGLEAAARPERTPPLSPAA